MTNTDDLISRSDDMQIDIDKMVSNFLGWKLPSDFNPDANINFYRQYEHDSPQYPIGTNLFTATQAKAMIEHILADAINSIHVINASEAIYQVISNQNTWYDVEEILYIMSKEKNRRIVYLTPPPSQSVNDTLEAKLNNLSEAVKFWNQVKESQEDTVGNGIQKDAYEWLRDSALAVAGAYECALINAAPKRG